MTKKTLEIKTTKRWGKGGNLVSLFLIFCLFLQPVAFAARSSAGGGKEAKFDTGKWMTGTAIGLGSMAVGSSIAGGLGNIDKTGGFSAGFNTSFKSAMGIQSFATNYSILAATNQVGRAVGAMGQYYGWNPRSTIFVSSLATGMASGGINPTQFGNSVVDSNLLSPSIGNGVALGAISGATEGAILSGLADKKGNLPIWAGPAAGLVGNFATGYVVNGFSTQKQTVGIVSSPAYDNYVKSGNYSLGPVSESAFNERTRYIADITGTPQQIVTQVDINVPTNFSFKNKFYAQTTNLAYVNYNLTPVTTSTLRNSFIGGRHLPARIL